MSKKTLPTKHPSQKDGTSKTTPEPPTVLKAPLGCALALAERRLDFRGFQFGRVLHGDSCPSESGARRSTRSRRREGRESDLADALAALFPDGDALGLTEREELGESEAPRMMNVVTV